MKKAQIGDTYVFTIPEEIQEDFSFIHSDQYDDMKRMGANSMEFTFIPNIHGFVNTFSYKMRLIKPDGSYVKDWEYNIEGATEEDKELFSQDFIETDSRTDFLNYISKFEKYITKK